MEVKFNYWIYIAEEMHKCHREISAPDTEECSAIPFEPRVNQTVCALSISYLSVRLSLTSKSVVERCQPLDHQECL